MIATVGFVTAVLLQLLLALGILPVTFAWGGSQSVLTPSLRLVSVAAAVVLTVFAYVIRCRAGLSARVRPSRSIKMFAWLITVYLTINTLGNFASASTGESLLFGPLSLVIALACWVVSSSRIKA